MVTVHIPDLGQSVRVFDNILPEIAHSPLVETQMKSLKHIVGDELAVLQEARTAIDSVHGSTAHAQKALDLGLERIGQIEQQLATVKGSGIVPIGKIPALSKTYDLTTRTGDFSAARDAIEGARLALAETPGVDTYANKVRAYMDSPPTTPPLEQPAILAPADDPWVTRSVSQGQRAVRLLSEKILHPLQGMHVIGAENVPPHGGFLLTPTHGTGLDIHQTFLAGHERNIRSLTLDRSRLMLYKHTGAFPLSRGDGRAENGLAIARRIIDNGEPVAIFPEGDIGGMNTPMRPRSGAARLALETGTTVIPAASYGTKSAATRLESGVFHERTRIVAYGEPLNFAGVPATKEFAPGVRDIMWEATERVHGDAKKLYERIREGAHAT